MDCRLDKRNVQMALYEILFFRSACNYSKSKGMCATYSQMVDKK